MPLVQENDNWRPHESENPSASMYPIYDTVRKPEWPKTPYGCFWYFIGFCILALLVVRFVSWLW